MSAQSDSSPTAQIVDMVSLLDDSSRKRVVTSTEQNETATLLSIRQNLRYKACIGVDNIEQLRSQGSQTLANNLMLQLRRILDAEFGRLRVHRYRQVFTVGHNSVEGLVGGVLRVQFHARQVQLPGTECQFESRPLSVSWGVGESVLEAECERQRHQKSKY